MDGNDANTLQHDPLFKLRVDRLPLDDEPNLASAPTFSRLEHHVDRKDTYRVARAFVNHFLASYAEPPKAIVLDLDHSDDPTHGQQECTFYNHHYGTYCYLPLFIFEGLSQALITACIRPGMRPKGSENAIILAHLLAYLRQHWPHTHMLVRGDSHFATPEVLRVVAQHPGTDFVLGLAGNAVLVRHATPALREARRLHRYRCARAKAHGTPLPTSSRIYDECRYGAASWDCPWRVIIKAEVMTQDDDPRFVVTSLERPSPKGPDLCTHFFVLWHFWYPGAAQAQKPQYVTEGIRHASPLRRRYLGCDRICRGGTGGYPTSTTPDCTGHRLGPAAWGIAPRSVR